MTTQRNCSSNYFLCNKILPTVKIRVFKWRSTYSNIFRFFSFHISPSRVSEREEHELMKTGIWRNLVCLWENWSEKTFSSKLFSNSRTRSHQTRVFDRNEEYRGYGARDFRFTVACACHIRVLKIYAKLCVKKWDKKLYVQATNRRLIVQVENRDFSSESFRPPIASTIFKFYFSRQCSSRHRVGFGKIFLVFLRISKAVFDLVAEPFDFVDEKIDDILSSRWKAGQCHAKEIAELLIGQWTVADHHAATFNHPFLDGGCDCVQLSPPLVVFVTIAHAFRNVPKAHVCVLEPFGLDKTKAGPRGEHLLHVCGHFHSIVHELLKTEQTARFEH